MVSSTTPSSRQHRNFPQFTCFSTCNISSENSAKMRRILHCNKFSKNSIFNLCPDVLIVSSMFNLFNVSRSFDFSHLHGLASLLKWITFAFSARHLVSPRVLDLILLLSGRSRGTAAAAEKKRAWRNNNVKGLLFFVVVVVLF